MENFKNLYEKEILRDAQVNTHIDKSKRRLSLVRAKCEKDFRRPDGQLIFKAGGWYRFWVIPQYSDKILGLTCDFIAEPHKIDPLNPDELYWYAVPLGTFAKYFPTDYMAVEENGRVESYSLICDNDGYQILVPENLLKVRNIYKLVDELDRKKFNGYYTIVPRIFGNEQGGMFAWRIGHKPNPKSKVEYRCFNIITGELGGYNFEGKPITQETPVHQNSGKILRDGFEIRYKNKELSFKFVGSNLNPEYFQL